MILALQDGCKDRSVYPGTSVGAQYYGIKKEKRPGLD
jgi:hypothetical protein